MDKFVSDKEFLTYDDVLCYPDKSLESRSIANLGQFIRRMEVLHPIIPANMDTISGESLCKEQLESGGIAILHRYLTPPERRDIWERLNRRENLFISVGVSDVELDAIEFLHEEGIRRFCIDVAHGHSDQVKSAINYIRMLDMRAASLRATDKNRVEKSSETNSTIIAGNVATPEGFVFLRDAGADIVKVGIGPGSHCITRIVTGCGIPQLSAILDIVDERNSSVHNIRKYIPIIADGGIRHSGDIVKALVAGADLVMTGSLFAGCPETPGDIDLEKQRKVYRGMASKDAQVDFTNKSDKEIVPEGESSWVALKPPFLEVLHQIQGGIKSGMSYLGAKYISDLKYARFVKVSYASIKENGAHGKQM